MEILRRDSSSIKRFINEVRTIRKVSHLVFLLYFVRCIQLERGSECVVCAGYRGVSIYVQQHYFTMPTSTFEFGGKNKSCIKAHEFRAHAQ